MILDADTIAAIATPPGKGGVGIIRISGTKSLMIAKHITGKNLSARQATLTKFKGKEGVLDEGIAIYFQAPNSFTGEDVVELQGHGGPVVMDLLLNEVLNLGAKMAKAGEFSERAFLNDKLDLAQAEAIADLIDSGSQKAAKAAIQSLQGVFSKKVHSVTEQLIHIRTFVEAAIDFSDEDIESLSCENLAKKISQLLAELKNIQTQANQGQLLREGINVVIIGKPNAGKSSLLNQLVGNETAIVTDIAGTTRDVLKEYIHIEGLPIHIIDTAGLRKTEDIVEQKGVERTLKQVERADMIIAMFDACEFETQVVKNLLADWQVNLSDAIIVKNKIDLTEESSGTSIENQMQIIKVSIKNNTGLEDLKQEIKAKAGFQSGEAGTFSARRRHLVILAEAENCIEQSYQQLTQNQALELVAEELMQAQKALGNITGEFSSDDLLGEIFSNFCIGK